MKKLNKKQSMVSSTLESFSFSCYDACNAVCDEAYTNCSDDEDSLDKRVYEELVSDKNACFSIAKM